MRGELIPVELVKPLFIQFSKSISASFSDAADAVITEIGHKKKMTRAEKAELRARFVEVNNTAVDEGVKDTVKNIKHIAEEFADVRGKGENR